MPSSIRTVEPAEEPVTLDEAKTQLRVDVTDDDTLIQDAIEAAREVVEEDTGRAIVTQTWQLALDAFPGAYPLDAGVPGAGAWLSDAMGRIDGGIGYPAGGGTMGGALDERRLSRWADAIVLPRGRLQSVTSVQYLDAGGALQTLDPGQYVVDAMTEPARIKPAFGVAWPTTRRQANAVTVTFVCGYGAAADVPARVKQAVKLKLADFYTNRGSEASAVGDGDFAYRNLIARLRLFMPT